ncbi:MAG: hypothetical protein JNM56_00680 [Planctomycetia bacterium]|nr:hypothetical protein [Planctomycetia bacterium]
MNDEVDQGSDPILDALREQEHAARKRRERHEAVRASAPYQQQLARLGQITHAFLSTLRLSAFAVTRDPSLPEVSFFLRNLDDLVESAVMAAAAFREGGLNSGRRELRFMLELAVQALFVDEQMGRAPFEQRLVFFERKMKHTSVEHVKDLRLEMLGGSRADFVAETVRAWANASQYVHPTPPQLREKLALRERGVTPGCETVEQLETCVDQLFQAASIVVALAFHAIGSAFTGDILVDSLDGMDGWPFHASRFVAAVDEYFDYKHERQASLADIKARRERRLRQ